MNQQLMTQGEQFDSALEGVLVDTVRLTIHQEIEYGEAAVQAAANAVKRFGKSWKVVAVVKPSLEMTTTIVPVRKKRLLLPSNR